MTKYQRYDFQLLYQIYKGKARGENTFVAVRPTLYNAAGKSGVLSKENRSGLRSGIVFSGRDDLC